MDLETKKLPMWEFLFIIFLLAIYLLPSFSLGSTTLLVILFAYCAFLLHTDKNIAPFISKSFILITVLALAYALLTDSSSISESVSNRELKRFISKLYQYLTLYFPAILFIRVNKLATQKQKKWLIYIGIALMISVIITTWIFLIQNPNATREWENFEESASQGVANYYFIYAIPIIIATVAIVFTKAKGAMKLLPLGCIILGILFLVSAQYTLSILIAIIGILIQVFRNLRSSISKAIFICLMLIGTLFIPNILAFAISRIPSEQVSVRLGEIYDFLTGEGAGGYNLNGRLTLYGDTIKAFFYSPIWGNRKLDFDGHATFLTVLSDTGIIGAVPFYYLLVVVCNFIKEQMYYQKAQFNVIIMMFVMMGLTNPIHASMPLGLATWFLAPMIISLIFEKENKYETPMGD